jgi:hypothetical protein
MFVGSIEVKPASPVADLSCRLPPTVAIGVFDALRLPIIVVGLGTSVLRPALPAQLISRIIEVGQSIDKAAAKGRKRLGGRP